MCPNELDKEILRIVSSPTLTHEQKVANLANKADSLVDVAVSLELDEAVHAEFGNMSLRQALEEMLYCAPEKRWICDLFEGHAPLRPRYIIPDYAKFLKNGSEFLRLPAPADLEEALDSLLIIYKHVPSVTNYPVYLGQLDELLQPYLDRYLEGYAGSREEACQRVSLLLHRFMRHIDRTVLDSFAHANLGPHDTLAGRLIMREMAHADWAVPNFSLKYDPAITPDDFALEAVRCTLSAAKPSFANHTMFVKELGERYCLASCYNGLPLAGGSYTLCRLILGHIAQSAADIADFRARCLPRAMEVMAAYMEARLKFEVERSGFFQQNFLVREGLIERERFTAMFGLVGLADAVNILLAKEGRPGRFGHSEEAQQLGLAIMEDIQRFNDAHKHPYCEVSGGSFLLHAQVGIAEDVGVTPGTRIPIGEEPEELVDQLICLSDFHRFFPSGTGDIFPVDITVHKNPEFVLDIVKGAFAKQLRYLTFHASDSEVVRITGYLVKRSEMNKLSSGQAVMHDTTALGLGAVRNGKILERKVR